MRHLPIALAILAACTGGPTTNTTGPSDLASLPSLDAEPAEDPPDAAVPRPDADPVDADPADAGALDAAAERPAYCPPRGAGLLEVTGTPASPYFVHHPLAEAAATVVFVPGADGARDIVTDFIWPRWLANGRGVERVRVAVPYTTDGNIVDEGERLVALADELLLCFGGDPARVHLGGTSNGGLTAFATMLRAGDTFASLMGAPGAFEVPPSDGALRAALEGKRVLLAVGALDSALWRDAARALERRLVALGIAATRVELPGQGHILAPGFDATLFYDHWLAP